MVFKLNNVSNLTSARWAAAEGYDIISFNFDKSHENYIKPMVASEILPWISGLKFSGNFIHTSTETIMDIYRLLKLDMVEIECDDLGSWLNNSGIPIIIKINSLNFEKAFAFAKSYPLFIAFSIEDQFELPLNFPIEASFFSSNISEKKLIKKPYGLNFSSLNELETGVVDFEDLEQVTERWQNIK